MGCFKRRGLCSSACNRVPKICLINNQQWLFLVVGYVYRTVYFSFFSLDSHTIRKIFLLQRFGREEKPCYRKIHCKFGLWYIFPSNLRRRCCERSDAVFDVDSPTAVVFRCTHSCLSIPMVVWPLNVRPGFSEVYDIHEVEGLADWVGGCRGGILGVEGDTPYLIRQ